ncbi:MAG TPA: Spy/CpxP family protein refolding chaperone [Longimicrobiales bacterium]|nr:Spy/CpxP family protein refolding chaperone [Longimicrobiales bacterium]
MSRLALALLSVSVALPAPLSARQDHARHHSPYAGQEARDIKALSPEEIATLLAGDGMGFALAAELNGVPGPKHVLELVADLELSHEQAERVEAVRAAMAGEAVRLGGLLVEAERALDRAFAHGAAPREHVQRLVRESGELRARLRAVHLVAHLDTAEILTAEQIESYRRLRGYAATTGAP